MNDETIPNEYFVMQVQYWVGESYKYPLDLKAQRRCLENAKSSLDCVIERIKSIEKELKPLTLE